MVNDGEQSAIAAAVEPDVELGRLKGGGGGRTRLGGESSEEEGRQRFSDAEDRSWHSRQNSAALEDYTSTSAPVRPGAGAGEGEGVVGRGRKSCVSECSLDDVDLEAGPAEITKASPDKDEMNCRICHLGLESAAAESGAGIVLGCSCKDDLSCAHKQCAETWFKIRGNKICEICGSAACNVVGFGDAEFIEQWNESSNSGGYTGASQRDTEVLAGPPVPQLPSRLHGVRFRHILALPLQRPQVSRLPRRTGLLNKKLQRLIVMGKNAESCLPGCDGGVEVKARHCG